MTKNVFFSRPGSYCSISKTLIEEITNAKNRIWGSAYLLTNPNIQSAINSSNIIDKRFILHHVDEKNILNDSIKTVVLGVNSAVKMHSKFLIIDDTVWTGSFNLTDAAYGKNFEDYVRLPSASEYTVEYVEEFKTRYTWGLGGDKWYKYSNLNDPVNKECNLCENTLEAPTKLFDAVDHYFLNITCRHFFSRDNSGELIYSNGDVNYDYDCRQRNFDTNNYYTCSYCSQEKPFYQFHKINIQSIENKKMTDYSDSIINNAILESVNYHICIECLFNNHEKFLSA